MTDERDPQTFLEFLREIKNRMEKMTKIAVNAQVRAKEKSKVYYDQKTKRREFAVGDKVLAALPEDSTGLEAQWHRPYKVIEKTSPVTYKLRLPERKKEHTSVSSQCLETVERTNRGYDSCYCCRRPTRN